jgi:tetratricopeptide (TPR) repeat protein
MATFRRSVLTAALTLTVLGAQAQVLKDPQWQAWLDAGKTLDLERAAQGKLKSQADDDQVVIALAMAAVDDPAGSKLEASIAPLQACIDKRPQAACHYALGRIYGQQAMNASVFRMAGLAGKTKDQFIKAVELDPLLFDARFALTQFYLLAPGIAGGSVPKAKEVAVAAQAKQPEQAKVLRYLVAAGDKDWASAERELSSVKSGEDRGLQREVRNGWMRVGFELMEQKAYPKARGVFETLQRDYPAHAAGYYGMARMLAESGQADEAIKWFERARPLEGAERLPIDHRLGEALLAKGDKVGAKAALERFVANKRANPRNLEDAKKKLAELG